MRPFHRSPLWIAVFAAAAAAGPAQAERSGSNWVFRRGYYTHSPTTGLRVAQYAPLPQVAALPDVSPIRSGYRRSRTTLRGPYGSVDDAYQVESWGNGRGGLDAEWERFHDAWRSSFLSGGYGSGTYYGYGGYRPWPGYGGPGYGGPGYGGPGYGQPPYGPRPVPYGAGPAAAPYGPGAYGSGAYGPSQPWGDDFPSRHGGAPSGDPAHGQPGHRYGSGPLE